MAGAGYKLFNTGDVLTAAQVNTYLQEQAVMRFANAAARTTALSGVLAEGMMSYLDDTNSVEVYNGSAWVSVGSTGDITGVTAGTGISGGGTSGDVTITNSMATAIDAKGDLIVGTADNAFSRLASSGVNNQVLTVDTSTATGLKWAATAAPAYSGTRLVIGGSNLTINNATNTTINWTSETFDTDAYHSTSTNTSRITIPSGKAGKYWVYSSIYWEGSSRADGIVLRIYKNGAEVYRSEENKDTNLYKTIHVATTMDLVATDYLEIVVYQNSGTTLTINSNGVYNWFGVDYLGA